MATQYTSILKLALPVQGELSGTWGDVVNDNITSMVEEAIAGRAVINTWTANSHTLTTADGTTSESRAAILTLTDTGTALTGAGTVICPAASKIYIVENGTGQTITVKTSSGTGVAVPNTKNMVVFCDGTNVEEGITNINSLTLNGDGATVSSIKDEDNMASNSATALATQQSIKAYVDSQVGSFDTLAEVLAQGNTTGGTDIQFSAGDNITNASGDFTIDIAGDITLDAGGGDFVFSDDGTEIGRLRNVASGFQIQSSVSNKDLLFVGSDAGVDVTALTLDMSAAGIATFNSGINIGNRGSASDPTLQSSIDPDTGVFWGGSDILGFASGGAEKLRVSSEVVVNDPSNDVDFRVESNGQTHMLFVDAGNDAVAFGTTDIDNQNNSAGSSADNGLAYNLGSGGYLSVARYGGIVAYLNRTDSDGTILDIRKDGSTVGTLGSNTARFFIHNNYGTGSGFRFDNGFITPSSATGATEDNTTDLGSSGARFKDLYLSSSVLVNAAVPRITLTDTDGTNTIGDIRQVSDATVIKSRNGSSNGSIKFNGDNGTTETEYGRFDSNGVFTSRLGAVFNEDSADVDFRVESNSNTHALFVDAGNDRVDMAVPLRVGYNEITATANAGIGQFATATSGSGELWTDINTGVNGYSSMPSEISVMNTADDTTNTFAGIFFQAGETSAGSGVSAARIGAIRTAALAADLAFATRAAGTGTMAEHMRLTNDGKVHIGDNTDYGAKLNIVTADNSAQLALVSTDEDANQGPLFKLYRNSASPLAGDYAGAIYFDAKDSAGNRTTYSEQLMILNNVTNSSEEATMIWNVAQGGTTGRERMRFSGSEAVFNEGSADLDFRVESNNNTNMIFVDAGNDAVGIGNGSPGSFSGDGRDLVIGTTGGDNGLSIISGTSGTGNIYFGDTVTTGTDSRRGQIVYNHSNNKMNILTNASERMSFSASDVIINDGSADTDFRVESNGNTHMLFVDAGNDAVGIGTSSAGSFTIGDLVVGDGVGARGITIFAATDNESILRFADGTSGDQQYRGQIKYNHAEDSLNFHANGASGSAENLILKTSEAVFNEGGIDTDFRVESNSNANALVVDAGNSTVGINTSAGNSGLTVSGGGTMTAGWNKSLMMTANFPVLTWNSVAGSGGYSGIGYDASSSNHSWNFYHKGTSEDVSGTAQIALTIKSGEIAVNEGSSDQDFRVESDSNTHALFVDAGNSRVGINEDNPGAHLHVLGNNDSDGATIKLQEANNNTSDTLGTIFFGNNADDTLSHILGYTNTNNTTSYVRINSTSTGTVVKNVDFGPTEVKFNDNGADVDFRVESDSNNQALLVDAGGDFVAMGNTIKNPVSGFADQHGVGIDVLNGDIQIASDSLPLELGRTSTAGANGVFLQMRAGGTAVGALRNVDSDLVIHTTTAGHEGLRLGDGYVAPTNNSGAVSDNSCHLGLDSARFVSLKVSSGVQFGNTSASAELLDDYEEGTWTPAVRNSTLSGSVTYSAQNGYYVKVGSFVSATFYLVFTKGSLSGGTLQFTGLPFSVASLANMYPQAAILIDNLEAALTNPLLQITLGQTTGDFIQGNGSTGNHAGLSVATYIDGTTSAIQIRGTINYRAA